MSSLDIPTVVDKVDLASDEDETDLSLTASDFLAVVVYFVLVLAVGFGSMFRPNRDTIEGFFLAGKYMFWFPVGASIFASNIGSEHFIGLAGTGAASGISVAAFEFNSLILLQLLGFVFLPVFIASKVRTLPEFMEKRFGGRRISVYLAVLSMILYIFTKISVDLYSGAIFIQQALKWDIYISTLMILALTCVCTLGGGLAAVIYIDVVQVAIMIGGSLTLLVKGLEAVGGWEALQEKYMMSIPNVTYVNPNNNGTCGLVRADSWQILRSVNSDMPWPGFILGQTPASIWYWCADQMMVQKALSAKSLSDAQGATIFTGWIKILPMFLLVIPGMISRVLYPNSVGCVDPEICKRACGNPVSCSNIAYPTLVLGIMPEGFRGVMIAVMLAALMSDLTSIFNSASTLFTIDIYSSFRKSAGTQELLLIGKGFILVLVILSIAWIPLIQEMQGGQLYIYIQSVAAYLSPPIAVVYCIAICWKRANEKGAFWALMYGLIMGLLKMTLDFIFREPPCMQLDTRPAFVKIHYMYFAAFLFFSTAIVCVLVSLATQPPPKHMLIRTTFGTRFDSTLREDEVLAGEGHEEMLQLQASTDLGEEKQVTEVFEDKEKGLDAESGSTGKPGCIRLLYRWCEGVEAKDVGDKHHREMEEHINALSALPQTTAQKVILYVNLVIIVSVALAFYIYFSINPFTQEEIQRMFDAAKNKTNLLDFTAYTVV